MTKTITIEELKSFCQRYDQYFGSYMESQYEGWAVYDAICDELNISTDRDEYMKEAGINETH